MLNQHQKKIYWGSTILFSLIMLMSGFMNLTRNPQILEGFKHLQLPAHLPLLIGTFKLLGVIALLLPKFPKVKEWAYAGFCFNMIGASFLHLMSADPVGQSLVPMFLLIPMFVSYFFKPEF